MTLWICDRCAPDVTCTVRATDGTIPYCCTAGEYSDNGDHGVCDFREWRPTGLSGDGFTGIPAGTISLLEGKHEPV